MKRFVPITLLLMGCGAGLTEVWEKEAESDPIGTLYEIADSLNSPSFRKRMRYSPLAPKVSNLFITILEGIRPDTLNLSDALKLAEALNLYMKYLYDFGLFDERWERAVFAYKLLLSGVKRRLRDVNDLDSLASITRKLKPFVSSRVYKAEYESLIDMYRRRSIESGDIRWGMKEEDVYEILGYPQRVDSVMSISESSFGKILHYPGKKILIMRGRVEDIFGEE